ncbi:RNA recognition motif domain, eukaryote, nucleotide-binding alpha-beta plait domain protein [Tanacetum coccineum]
MEQLRDEMRKCSRATRIEFPRFGGDDVKGWLFRSEHYIQVNNIPYESKVNFIATHLFGIALLWHGQILKIMGKDMAWVIYKDLILQRFGNVETAKFSCNSVMNSNLSLNLDDDEDYVVYGCYQEKDEKDKCAHKMFDEMPIKKILKQDIIAEYSDAFVKESIEVQNGLEEDVGVESFKDLVDEDNGLIDDELSESNFNQDIRNIKVLQLECVEIVKSGLEKWTRNGVNNMEGQVVVEYVRTTKTTVEFILATKQVFDPGGKWVGDSEGLTICKSRILVVVTSYVRVEKSLLGSKEYEFRGVGELVHGNISKQGMGGNEPILNDTFVGIADKLTDKWFKISTFMETQVGKFSIRLWLGSYGYQICLKTFLLEQDLEYGKVMSAVIVNDGEGKSRGSGFISFESHENAKKTIKALNDAEIGSKKWFVGKAMKKSERDAILKRVHRKLKPDLSNMLVRNIATSVNENDSEKFLVHLDVLRLQSKMNPEVTRSVASASEVTKFAIPKKFVREAFEKLLRSKLVSNTQIKSIVEPMSLRDMSEEIFKNVVKEFECCYSQRSFVMDIEIAWKLDRRLQGSHTLPSAIAMKSSFKVDLIRESIAANKWSLGQLKESSNVVKYTMLTEREACVKVLFLEVARMMIRGVNKGCCSGVECRKELLVVKNL